jgi:hypothetical protein
MFGNVTALEGILIGPRVALLFLGTAVVRSHEERWWLFEEPTQSRMSPSIL